MRWVSLAVLAVVLILVLWRPRRLAEGWFTMGGAALLAALGFLHPDDGLAVWRETAPTLAFLAGMLVAAFVADQAGVFRAAAAACRRWAGSSAVRLYAFLFILGCLVTTFFSLDTTAVTMTPIVLAVAQQLGLPPLPFVWLAVYTANTGSLLLPVSNLTNLIAAERYHLSLWTFARVMVLPALLATSLNLGLFLLLFHRQLAGVRSEAVASAQVAAASLLGSASRQQQSGPAWPWRAVWLLVAALLAGLGLAPYLGWPLWWVADAGAALMAGVAVAGRLVRPADLARRVSWNVIPFVFGLFLVIRAVQSAGVLPVPGPVDQAASALGGWTTTRVAQLAGRWALLGAGTANLLNNLPAELLLLPAATPGPALYGLLLGVNLGPNLTIIGSLATILVLSLARQQAVAVSGKQYLQLGVVITPALLGAGVLGLTLGHLLGWL
ncbi:MAG: hypothetical protein IMX01_08070 [Limnochordaceae bacterium]|nr:hypothetical protein [Limnochordaceae bacterium]